MSKKYFHVVALGECLIDLTGYGNSKMNNPLFEANPGGAPCNCLCMVNKFNKKTAFIGKVGKDFFGELLKKTLMNKGINADNLIQDGETNTTLAFVKKLDNNDRDFIFYRKNCADISLKKEEVNPLLIKNSEIFHFGTLSLTDNLSSEATIYGLKCARENNLLISFDPNLRIKLWENEKRAKEAFFYCLSKCDLLKISDNEIEFYTDEKDIEKGIKIIKNNFNGKLIIATLGKDGCIVFYKDKIYKYKGFKVDNIVDTTGAGDTFWGCVLANISRSNINNLTKEDFNKIIATAQGAAAIVTTKYGAINSMPSIEEIDAFLQGKSL